MKPTFLAASPPDSTEDLVGVIRKFFRALKGVQWLGENTVDPPWEGPLWGQWSVKTARSASSLEVGEKSREAERRKTPSGTSFRKESWTLGDSSQDRCFSIKRLPSKRMGVPANYFPNPIALKKEKVRSIKISWWCGLAWRYRKASLTAGSVSHYTRGLYRASV